MKYKSLKDEYRSEDHNLKEQHNRVQILKERCRKIKEFIHEKKRLENETGIKQVINQEDIEKSEQHIIELEQQKVEVENSLKAKLERQDMLVSHVKRQLKELKSRLKEKEND